VLVPPISLAVLGIHHLIPGSVLATIVAWPIWLKACATMMVGETAALEVEAGPSACADVASRVFIELSK
jgi:hypothetical protein